MSVLRLLFLGWALLAGAWASAADMPPVVVGLDGEFGLLNSTSAQAIERGILTAMDEINRAGGVLGGRPLKLVSKDNRSVPARGVENIRQFAEIPDLVAVVGGRFSPVILEELDMVHEKEVILLDAWGSADGITDHDHQPSYTFRLSLRDRYAMPVILAHALSKGAQQVGILLPNTGWGRSNARAAQRYAELNPQPVIVDSVWYNWGDKNLLGPYQTLTRAGAEAVVLVANDIEASILIRQLADVDREQWVPLISHWGVTGGHFIEKAGPALQQMDFSVVQTFSLSRADPEMRARVMAVVGRLFDIHDPEDLESQVGFGHAYDLIHILARAIDLAGTPERPKVRAALEQVRNYRGLTGDYPQPFTPEDHNALRLDQVFMARYREDGVLVPLETTEGAQ